MVLHTEAASSWISSCFWLRLDLVLLMCIVRSSRSSILLLYCSMACFHRLSRSSTLCSMESCRFSMRDSMFLIHSRRYCSDEAFFSPICLSSLKISWIFLGGYTGINKGHNYNGEGKRMRDQRWGGQAKRESSLALPTLSLFWRRA